MSNYASGTNSSLVERDENGNLVTRVKVSGSVFPATNITVTPILITGANVNTEIQHSLSQNIRRLFIQVTGTDGENQHASLRVSFVEDGTLDSGGNSREYILVTPGSYLDLSDLNLENYIVYLQCSKQDRAVKILEYT